MTFDDLPSFDGPRPPSSARVRRRATVPVLSWNRREFVRAGAAAAFGVGIASLGIFPAARRASASHGGTDGYQIKPLPCPGYADGHDCFPGCGPSDPDPNACVTNSSSHFFGWHRAGCNSAHNRKWKLRKNGCLEGTGWDGWRWKYDGLCGCCTSITFRCHDGWRCNLDCANCSKTICKWTVDCTPRPSCA